jgi:hypothetical protein
LQQGFCLARFGEHTNPVVVEALYLGGAHCCWALLVARPGPAAGLSTAEHDFGNINAVLEKVGGSVLIVSGDNRFAYAFSDFGDSGFPVLAMSYRNSNFVDVTRAEHHLVEEDAQVQWHWFSRDRLDPYGYLAAWTADQCELGNWKLAWGTLDELDRQGTFKAHLFEGVDWPRGWTYLHALRSFLGRIGYCPQGPV